MTHATEFPPTEQSSALAKVFAFVLSVPILVGFVLMLGLATSPLQVRYTIAGGTLTVDAGNRLDGSRSVPLSLAKADGVSLGGGRRLRGTAMPGLCSGKWWFPDGIGEVFLAGNCATRGIRVTTESETLVLTPPDPDAFLRAIEARTDTTVLLAPPIDAGLFHAIPVAASVLMLAAWIFLILTFVVAPGRLRYVVTGGELRVETLFSRRVWPAKDLRAARHAPTKPRRVVGTAFPGYYTGRFRLDGEPARVFASTLEDGVIVEGPDGRVFLSPAEPDVFLSALHREGARLS